MAESGIKKRRIARIGGISSGKEATKLGCEERLMQDYEQDDCNLVYNIMEAMNKSHNTLSYQQLQEFGSKKNSTRTKNSVSNSSSKQSNKAINSKPMKKIVPGKKYPLMAKCQQSMKYLNKNRNLPKPRAHVGSNTRPSPTPQSNNDTVLNKTENHKLHSIKINKKSKCSPVKNAKAAHSVDDSCGKNASQIPSYDKEHMLISDSDSDNEFEQFIKKHHPEKCTRRKTAKNSKFQKKKRKKFICAKKVVKVTSRTLSESEESAESEIDSITKTKMNVDQELPRRRYERIVDYASSGESAVDTHINDCGTVNDSSSSSEDENKSLNNGNVIDFANRLGTLPGYRSSVVPSTSSSERSTLNYDALKLRCKIPCNVVIKRDPLLDKRAASLLIDNSPATNAVPVSKANDEDDCIIISETITDKFTNQNSGNNTPSIEDRNTYIGDSTIISKSPCAPEASTGINDMHNGELIISPDSLKPQIGINSNESSENSTKEVSGSVTALTKSLWDNDKDKCSTLSEATRPSHSSECADKNVTDVYSVSQHLSNIPPKETESGRNGDTTATEKETFNVQILSVKSLNESDIIMLSDDEEEKDEAIPTGNESKESEAEDSDVEIICLDSSIVHKEKCASENIQGNLDNKTYKVNEGKKENPGSSSVQPLASSENDCIILDDLDIQSENSCTAKNIDKVQLNSQLIDKTNNGKTNSIKNVQATSGNAFSSDKESILKILGTIDFNCIKKVLNATTSMDTQKESTPVKAENSLPKSIETSERTPDSFPEKQKRGQNDSHLSQTQFSIDASIAPTDSFEVEIKKSSLSTGAVDTHENGPKLVQHSNVFQNIKSCSETVPSIKKPNSISSKNKNEESSTVCIKSSANIASPKSFVSETEIVSSSHKTEPNSLLYPDKNQQLLPVCTKMESYESPFDELDILAAKSIRELSQEHKKSILPLMELYRTEYEKYMNIKCTEQNVSAGLKLLEEKQTKRLLAISSSIENIVKKDVCLLKIKEEYGNNRNKLKSCTKSDSVETVESLEEIKKPSEIVTRPSVSNFPDIEKDDRVKIFNESVVKKASEYLNSDGSSSSQEVYNHLINSVCAECGKQAVAACSGCAKIYYCSEKCGMSSWSKGHYQTCRR